MLCVCVHIPFFSSSRHLVSTIGCDTAHFPPQRNAKIERWIVIHKFYARVIQWLCVGLHAPHTLKCQQKCSVYDVCQKSKSDAVPENVTFSFVFLIVCFVVFFKFCSYLHFFFLSLSGCIVDVLPHLHNVWITVFFKCAQPIKLVEFRQFGL